MFESIQKEPKEIQELVIKVLRYHFNESLDKTITETSRKNQVKAWIKDTAEAFIKKSAS